VLYVVQMPIFAGRLWAESFLGRDPVYGRCWIARSGRRRPDSSGRAAGPDSGGARSADGCCRGDCGPPLV